MIADVWAVTWKELKELLRLRGSVRTTVLSLLIPSVVLGVFLPWQSGRHWLDSPLPLVFWSFMPVILVITMIADCFAGERERHTLETLLASRLPDRAILFGKLGAAVAYGWVLALAMPTLGLATVNLALWEGHLRFYSPSIVVGGLGLSLLSASLTANAGLLISLRAPTVRQAQQTLSFVLLFLTLVPPVATQMLPAQWKESAFRTLMSMDLAQVGTIAIVVLVVLDCGLLTTAMARFRRTRLMAD